MAGVQSGNRRVLQAPQSIPTSCDPHLSQILNFPQWQKMPTGKSTVLRRSRPLLLPAGKNRIGMNSMEKLRKSAATSRLRPSFAARRSLPRRKSTRRPLVPVYTSNAELQGGTYGGQIDKSLFQFSHSTWHRVAWCRSINMVLGLVHSSSRLCGATRKRDRHSARK